MNHNFITNEEKVTSYFKILVEEIHSVVIATVDGKNSPTTRVIDLMLYDQNGIYFLTAKGKNFYKQLMKRPYVSLSGLKGSASSMTKKAFSLSGKVKNVGSEKIEDIFSKNPYMAEIYPSVESRSALEVFCLYQGDGEFFDLTTTPITRGHFSFGGHIAQTTGYVITDACDGCRLCIQVCPQNCIETGIPFVIEQEHCLHCGNCYEICPISAIQWIDKF